MHLFNVAVIGALDLNRQLAFFKLPNGRRRNVLRKMTRAVMKFSRKRLREQRDLEGNAFEKRKRGRGKVLIKLSRYLKDTANAHQGKVYFNNPFIGRVARRHQEGIDELMTAAALKASDPGGQDKPATRRQAKALVKLGYKIKRKSGKGYKRVSQKTIRETMSRAQAGVIIRALRDEQPKTSWFIPVPKRSFLGVTPNEFKHMMNDLHDSIVQPMQRTIGGVS